MDTEKIILISLSVLLVIISIINLNSYNKIKKIENETTIEVPKNEVFHIYNNSHTYDDAVEKCKIYGARLATEDEIKDAWKDGANWCNYGWSEGQKALFPAQKDAVDYENKQISVINEKGCSVNYNNKCQKVGVNGGFFDNKKLQFGVNCYGVKPDLNDNDLENRKKDDLRLKKIEEKYNKYTLSEKTKKERKKKEKEDNNKKLLESIHKDVLLDHNNISNKWSKY